MGCLKNFLKNKLNLLILPWETNKTIEDQRKKQVEVLKDLKPEEQTKAIEGKSSNKNNQSIAVNVFNDLIEKRKSKMNELYESVDKNKLYFEYVSPTKDFMNKFL